MPSSLTRLDVPFIDDLGIDFLDAAPGEGRVALQLQPRHLNSWHVAIAGRSLDPGARGGVTVEMKTSFLQPGPAGTRLVATGRAFHRSTTMSFCEGEIRDADDRLIAKAIGTFKTLKRVAAASGLGRAERAPYADRSGDAG